MITRELVEKRAEDAWRWLTAKMPANKIEKAVFMAIYKEGFFDGAKTSFLDTQGFVMGEIAKAFKPRDKP